LACRGKNEAMPSRRNCGEMVIAQRVEQMDTYHTNEECELLPLSRLWRDQPRPSNTAPRVREFAERMRNGVSFPPVDPASLLVLRKKTVAFAGRDNCLLS
jgi:hypothetical protein